MKSTRGRFRLGLLRPWSVGIVKRIQKPEKSALTWIPEATSAPVISTIDLRSDTVTRPTVTMLDAMMRARVGDDVYGEDDTVNALQQKAADLFGMEAGLFCPSGTMTNQIAIKIHTQPGDEVICDQMAHVYLYEGGGIAVNSGASVRPLRGDHGRFADQVRQNINKREDAHFPVTRLVTVESTVNRSGGCCWELAELKRLRQVCNERSLALHLDGARLFNALVARGESPKDYGELSDTISICLSKGLGAPVGLCLAGAGKSKCRAGTESRKGSGGGMRQAGYLAAAGIYALDHHVVRLKEDHAKAKALERELRSCSCISSVLPVETNIVIFELDAAVSAERFDAHLRQRSVRIHEIGPQTFRAVFHLDVSESQFDALLAGIRAFSP